MKLTTAPLTVTLRVNGDDVTASPDPHRTLLELLRYDLGLTGTKQGCDVGDCGACTVLLDGAPVLSCLVLAADLDGAKVETVESLAAGPELSPLQGAFVDRGAAQCGFCTPGMLMTATALLRVSPTAPREQVAAAIAGNLCRCTGYVKIIDAIEAARDALSAEDSDTPPSAASAGRPGDSSNDTAKICKGGARS